MPSTFLYCTHLCPIYEELDNLHLKNHPEIFRAPLNCSRKKLDIETIIENPNRELFIAETNNEISKNKCKKYSLQNSFQ